MEILKILREKLKDTSLSENEIGVYLALLKIGESTTGKILNEYKMSAGKVYVVLDKLIKKGLVSHITKEKIKHFKAHDPQNIVDYLEKEKFEIEKKEDAIKKMLPDLSKALLLEKDDITVEIYEGLDGFKTAVNKVIEEHEYGAVEYEFDHFDFPSTGGNLPESIKYIMLNYSKGMIKKKVKAKLLLSSSNEKSLKDVKDVLKGTNSEIRYIKNQKFATIFFTKDKTLIIDYIKPHVVFIRSKTIAEGFRKMFESLWQLGKEI